MCFPRAEMPQIEATAIPALVVFARDCGVAVSRQWWPTEALSALQCADAFDAARFPRRQLDVPILCANDLTILDGHHRWQAHKHFKTGYCPIVRFDLTFTDAKSLLFRFPGVYSCNIC